MAAAAPPGERVDGRPVARTLLRTGVYGGYFGAAQGVLLMGFLGLLLAESLQRQNALKNVLAGARQLVAAVVFVATRTSTGRPPG